MKTEGILIEYNNLTGKIITSLNKTYLVLYTEVIDKSIKKGDNVIFITDSYNGVNIARFIRMCK